MPVHDEPVPGAASTAVREVPMPPPGTKIHELSPRQIEAFGQEAALEARAECRKMGLPVIGGKLPQRTVFAAPKRTPGQTRGR